MSSHDSRLSTKNFPILRMMYGPETTDLAKMYYEVYKHKEEDGELKGSIFYNAPALILAHDIGKNSIGPTNCAIAMRNIEILALTISKSKAEL